MRAAVLALALTGPAAAQGVEVEIQVLWEPDGTGERTENVSVHYEDGEIEIEENAGDNHRYVEREARPGEGEALVNLVRARLAWFDWAGGPEVDPPYLVLRIELEGESRELELEERYPVGGVPPELTDLMARYFETVWE